MTEEALKRIPFSIRDEMQIISMARWMKFMGGFQIVAGGLGLLVIVIFALLMFATGDPVGMITGALLGTVGIAVVVVAIWQGFLLFRSADFFDLVAKTDDADQDYVALGFAKLKTFFIVEVVFAVLGLVLAFVNTIHSFVS